MLGFTYLVNIFNWLGNTKENAKEKFVCINLGDHR